MPLSIFASSEVAETPANSSTRYFPVFGPVETSNYLTEGGAQLKMPVSGKFFWAQLRLNANPSSGTASVFTFRVNAVDTAISMSTTAGTSNLNYADNVNEVTVSAGDLISWKMVSGSTGSSMAINGLYIYFLPDDPNITVTPCFVGATSTSTSVNAAQSNYHAPWGDVVMPDTSPSGGRAVPFTLAGDLKNFQMYSDLGGRTLTMDGIVKNGVDDAITRCALAQDVTGRAEHNSNPVTIANQDYILFKVTRGATGTSRNMPHLGGFLYNSSKQCMIGGFRSGGYALAFNAATTFYSVVGGSQKGSSSTTHARVAWPVKAPCTITNMTLYLSNVPTGSGTTTFKLLKNGVDSGQGFSFTSASTTNQYYQDSSHPVSLAVDDVIAVEVNPSGTGSILSWFGVTFQLQDDRNYTASMSTSAEAKALNFITAV